MATERRKMTADDFIRKSQKCDVTMSKILAYSELVSRSFIDEFYLQNNNIRIKVVSQSLHMCLIPDVNNIISQYMSSDIDDFEDEVTDWCNKNYNDDEFSARVGKLTEKEITTISAYDWVDQISASLAVLSGPTIILDPYEIKHNDEPANLTQLPIDNITNMSHEEIHEIIKRRIPPNCTDRTGERTSKFVYEIVQFVNRYKFD